MYQEWIKKYDEYIQKEIYCPMCRKKGKRVNIYDYEFFLRSVYKRFFRTFCVKLCFMDNNVYYDHTSRHFNVAHTDIGNYSMENRFMEGGQVMTDEEKKAIEFWNGQIELYSKEGRPYKTLQILLNLIEKQDNIIKGNECVIETGANNEKVLLEALDKKDKTINKFIDELIQNGFDSCCSECTYECERDYVRISCCTLEYFEKEEG